MSPYWMMLLLMSGLIPEIFEVSSKHITKKKGIPKSFFSRQMKSEKAKFLTSLKRNKVSTLDRVADEPLKQGSFKIDDGKVIGGGIYEIGKDGVSIDLKIKIAPDYPESPKEQPTPTTTSPNSPGGQGTTASPEATTTSSPGVTTGPGATETTAAPSETTPSSSSGSDVEQEALSLHNKFRAVHDAPAMTLNAEMSQSAASYAQKIASQGSLRHASPQERDNNGENLSYGCSTSKGQTATEAVTNWYNEICDPGYSFGTESTRGAGHFTQLVWKESVELGFGKADVDEGNMKCTYYVARYKKAGNMIGEVAKNVVKGSFDESYCSTIKKSKLNKLA